jgi:hypothetical protein
MLLEELMSTVICAIVELAFVLVASNLETASSPRVMLREPTRMVYACLAWEKISAMENPRPWFAPIQ